MIKSLPLSAEESIECYKQMSLIRKFEEKAAQLYSMRLIGGFCHLYIGQEAIATGMKYCMEKGDASITSYRDHGMMLAAGSDPRVVMAELLGKATGCSKGKGGSMHIFDLEKHFYGGHGIVGAQVSLGTGIAFANKYKENGAVCFTYMGDGAINQGQVYESFNMAALWKLPVVYVIENNEYSMGTSVARACAPGELYKRGESFSIPGYQVNGMDIFSVIENGKMAAKYCREGKGPILLEMKTYRYKGHSMSDPGNYRTKEEIEAQRQNYDPLQNLKVYLLEKNICTEEQIKAYEKEIKQIVEEVATFAQASKYPSEDELYTDVYCSN